MLSSKPQTPTVSTYYTVIVTLFAGSVCSPTAARTESTVLRRKFPALNDAQLNDAQSVRMLMLLKSVFDAMLELLFCDCCIVGVNARASSALSFSPALRPRRINGIYRLRRRYRLLIEWS